MTILDLIQKTAPFLEKAGVPDARLDTELLVAHVLHLKRMDLYLQFERVLSDRELDQLRPLVKRRAAREPLQHILGAVEFAGVQVRCTAQALVPRPETEWLAERVIHLLTEQPAAQMLEIGTGSGAIALSVARACPGVAVVATDLSEEALALARSNAESNDLRARVDFRAGDLFAPLRAGEAFDLIVSNPPYIPSAEIAVLPPEVRHDPVLALDGGADGLDVIRRLIADARKHLKPGGWLVMEIGYRQDGAVRSLLETAGWSAIELDRDLQGVVRIAVARAA